MGIAKKIFEGVRLLKEESDNEKIQWVKDNIDRLMKEEDWDETMSTCPLHNDNEDYGTFYAKLSDGKIYKKVCTFYMGGGSITIEDVLENPEEHGFDESDTEEYIETCFDDNGQLIGSENGPREYTDLEREFDHITHIDEKPYNRAATDFYEADDDDLIDIYDWNHEEA